MRPRRHETSLGCHPAPSQQQTFPWHPFGFAHVGRNSPRKDPARITPQIKSSCKIVGSIAHRSLCWIPRRWCGTPPELGWRWLPGYFGLSRRKGICAVLRFLYIWMLTESIIFLFILPRKHPLDSLAIEFVEDGNANLNCVCLSPNTSQPLEL